MSLRERAREQESNNQHDADINRRSYFIKNLGGQISFGLFNLGHLYKFLKFDDLNQLSYAMPKSIEIIQKVNIKKI